MFGSGGGLRQHAAFHGSEKTSPREFNPYETPFKPFMPTSAYAMAASRHMHEYSTTREQLAEVAVAARRWAQLNPVAFDQRPLDISGVLGAKMVSYPFTVRDCRLVTDGEGAIILTSAARAKTLKKPPVYVLGNGTSIIHASISNISDLTLTGAIASGAQAYQAAGLGPQDMDIAQLYDAFTIHTNSHSLVPTHPFSQRDRHDAPWLADEPVPCVTALIDDVIVIAKHAIG